MILGIVLFLLYRISKQPHSKKTRKSLVYEYKKNKLTVCETRVLGPSSTAYPLNYGPVLARLQRGMTVFIRVLLENRFTDTQRLQNKVGVMLPSVNSIGPKHRRGFNRDTMRLC